MTHIRHVRVLIMRMRQCFIFVASLLCAGLVHAQERRSEFSVHFPQGSAAVDPGFADNARQLSAIVEFLDSVGRDSSLEITGISFCGTTSLEGSSQLNRKLAGKRLAALESVIRERVAIPDGWITRDDNYIPWEELKAWVRASATLPQKDAVLEIIGREPRMVEYAGGTTIDARIPELERLDGGSAWKELNRFFSDMRSASAVIVTLRKQEPAVVEPEPVADPEPDPEPVPEPEPEVISAPEPEPECETVPDPLPVLPQGFVRRAHLKTDLVGWGLSAANIAGEIDLCEHWSFALPLYYSGVNLYLDNLKFRTFSVAPEFRYWFSALNDGLFVGGHLGMAYYNFAFMGDWRYQDHDGNTPALGGGLSIGYRLPITRDGRWKLEFSVGGGAYRAHYDVFDNVPGGLLVETRKKTYVGPDQATVSFAYAFDIMKKGGRK